MAEKISVEIGLDGGAEVEQQLADIGVTGQQAFADLAAAANKLAAATDKATEAQAGFSLEAAKTTVQIAKYSAEIALTGVEIVQAVRHHDSLIRSLLKLGSATSTTIKVVSALTPELALAGVTIGSTAAAITAGVVAFAALEKVVTKIAASQEKTNNSLQTLAATSGKSFDELQRGEAAFEQIGIKAETFRGTIAKVSETLAGTEVTGLTKGMKDIVELTKQIAAGQTGITFADWVTVEDKVKGVSIAMKQAADSGKNATQVLLEFIRNADLATGIKVGAAFGLSEADVDRVRRLKGDISDLIQRIQGAGVLISPAAAAAFDNMRTSIQNADSAWVRFKQSIDSTAFSTVAATFSSIMNDMKATSLNASAAIVESFNQAFSGMLSQAAQDMATLKSLFSGVGTIAQSVATAINASVANWVGNMMRGMGASEAAIKATQDSINGVTTATQQSGQAAQQASGMYTQWGTAAAGAANTAKAGVEQGVQLYTQWGTAAGQAGQQAQQAGQQAKSGSDMAYEGWLRLLDILKQYLGLAPQAGAPATGGGFPRKAGGGLLGGAGTGTSDSNLAWVSRGEYITPARAVAQPGVLAFLEALRRSGGNLSRVLNGMGRFALGGMVPRMPAYATGGLAGGSNVTIQFPGLPAISGLRASSDVVDQLHKAAALAQVRSGGRKPSRYS